MLERSPLKAGWPMLAVLFAAGCGSGGSGYSPTPSRPVSESRFKPGDELSMFPAKVGNQWTYAVATTREIAGKGRGSGQAEISLKIVGVTPTEGGSILDIDVLGPSDKGPGLTKVNHQVWEITTKGIYQRSVGTTPVNFDPIAPAILFPPDPERKFSWKGKGPSPEPEPGTQTLDSKILPGQVVDTENEQIWAIPVETKGTFQTTKSKGLVASTAYWAPGVGLVRFRQETATGTTLNTLTMKLKAKSVQ